MRSSVQAPRERGYDAGPKQERTVKTTNVNSGSRGFAVTPQKYEPIRRAILASVQRGAHSLTFQELVASVATRVPAELFPKKGSVSWYTKVVQLDLEAKGQLERVPDVTPQRIRRVRRARQGANP
jgi:hypothetical protein